MSFRSATLVAIAAACLAGCAGAPLIDVTKPGFTRTQDGGGDPATLAEARKSLLHLRGAYRDAMAEQLNATQTSGAGLVALGAAVAGMAGGSSNKNAILGVSLVGGTAYAVGNLTLDRRRVLAFDAGIRALDCAHAAVIPLDLGEARLKHLKAANDTLKKARRDVEDKVLELRESIKTPPNAMPLPRDVEQAMKALLSRIDVALQNSDKTRKAATRLAEDTREIGARLQNTVHAIAARVDGFIAQTVPDLTAVPQAIAGLGGFAAAFAPGAGIDKTLAKDLKAYGETAKSDNEELKERLKKVQDLSAKAENLVEALAAANEKVIEQLGTVDGSAVVTALKECKVADVALPLSLEPSTLSVDAKGGPGKGFAIRGGTKPYMVRWLDAAADGLSLSFTGGFADLAQVSATKEVPGGGYRLQVSDSAGGSTQLVVTVIGTQAAGAASGGSPGSSGQTDLTLLVRNINELKPFDVVSTKITIEPNGASLIEDKKKVLVKLNCIPPPPEDKRLARADLVSKLLGEIKSQTKSDPPANASGLVELKSTPANCLKD